MTNKVKFSDESALWVFPLVESVEEERAQAIIAALAEELQKWNSHGLPLASDITLYENRFLVVTTDEQMENVSGCAKDSLRKSVSTVLQEQGSSLAAFADVFFQSERGTEVSSRARFKTLFAENQINSRTTVFDTTVQTQAQLKASFRKALEDSWHFALVSQK